MKLLELELLSFHIEGRFVPIAGRDTYMTHSWAEATHWFRNATKARV